MLTAKEIRHKYGQEIARSIRIATANSPMSLKFVLEQSNISRASFDCYLQKKQNPTRSSIGKMRNALKAVKSVNNAMNVLRSKNEFISETAMHPKYF